MTTPLEFAVDLARQAGNMLRDIAATELVTLQPKEDHSPVSQADILCNRLIVSEIQDAYPQDGILSEEQPPAGLAQSHLVQPIWIIDPLDGTTNYGLGLPIWGVLIARLENGYPELAALFFPALGELYSAQRGQGAFLNGRPIQVEQPSPQNPFSFFACCSRTFRQYNVEVPYKIRILGSAAYTFCSVARGIALLGFEATPKLWDLAGPWLIVQEAGGVIEPLEGVSPFPLQVSTGNWQISFPTLAAATPAVAARAHQQIINKRQM